MRNLNEGKKKAPSYMAELSEIDKQSAIVAMEAKINKLAEMAEAKTQRLNMVSEDENLSELIDKKAMNEMRRNIKEIEKAKLKLEKLYEKACGSKPKEMVDEDASKDSEDSDLDDAAVGAMGEGYSTPSYEEDDTDPMNENVYGSVGFIPRDKDAKPEHPRFEEMSAEEIQDYIDANPDTLGGSSLYMAKMVRDEKLGMDPMNEEFNRFRKLAGIPLKEDLVNKIKQIKDYNETEDSLNYGEYDITYDRDENLYSVFLKDHPGDSSDRPEFESSSSEEVKNFLEKP